MARNDSGRIINWHRPLRPGQLSARYRRLRDQEPPEGHYDPDEYVDGYWDSYDYWDRSDAFDTLWFQLEARLVHAGPFNPLPLPAHLSAAPGYPGHTSHPGLADPGRPDQPDPVIPRPSFESRLASHYLQLRRQSADDLVAGHADHLVALRDISQRYLDGQLTPLVAALLFAPFWLRSPVGWTPPSSENQAHPHAHIHALIDHLFVEYPVPRFLYAAWLEPATRLDTRWLTWLVLLGQGGSLPRMTRLVREASDPYGWGPINSKLVALLHRVPASTSLSQGVMWAEVARLGGTEVEMSRLRLDPSYILDPTSYALDDDEIQFWRDTVRWLIRHRDELATLEDREWQEIARWARHRFTEGRYGEQRFQWRGRAPARALARAREYWQEVNRYGGRALSWSSRGWDWNGQVGQNQWTVHELTTTVSLHEESQAMHHCVRLYDRSCVSGRSAIFSLRRDGERVLTVEISPQTRQIVQARGTCNRSPGELEKSVLTRWHGEAVARAMERDGDGG